MVDFEAMLVKINLGHKIIIHPIRILKKDQIVDRRSTDKFQGGNLQLSKIEQKTLRIGYDGNFDQLYRAAIEEQFYGCDLEVATRTHVEYELVNGLKLEVNRNCNSVHKK